MHQKKKVLAIIGSASRASSNLSLVHCIAELGAGLFEMEIFEALSSLPHFDPRLSLEGTPPAILHVRERIDAADGVLISTPEYVFSIPSGLKNLIEWCVSTLVFSQKPMALVTASASGQKGHEELQLIMRTVEASFNEKTSLLIPGIRGKIGNDGKVKDPQTLQSLESLVINFHECMVSREAGLSTEEKTGSEPA